MSETDQAHAGQPETLAHALTSFYDEFAEFNEQTAFLCTALACLLAKEEGVNERVARGAECWSLWICQQLDDLQNKLRQLQKAAVDDSTS